MGLYSDASGEPGTLLESWSVPVPDSSDPGAIITISSVVHPSVSAGTPYWFVIEDTTGAVNMTWGSYSGTTGGIWVGLSATTLVQAFPTYSMVAIELDSVPEPSSGLLAGAGALLLWLRVKRAHRNRRKTGIHSNTI
jgi:hypothetical protein